MKARACGIVALAILAGGCSIVQTGHGKGHWSYSGKTGPEHWGDLSPEYVLAKTGKRQSPIDIANPKPFKAPPLNFRYKTTALNVVNNGHAIQQDCDEGSVLEVGGATYALKQFHFHGLSEHTVNGKHYAMEGHLVHQDAKGTLAVVGFFLVRGKENAFLKPLFDRMPAKPGERVKDAGVKLNIIDLLPSKRSYYAYDGSLTTPPCSEGVNWSVLCEPIEMSPGQLEQFRKLYANNYRPVQPLNGREVVKVEP